MTTNGSGTLGFLFKRAVHRVMMWAVYTNTCSAEITQAGFLCEHELHGTHQEM